MGRRRSLRHQHHTPLSRNQRRHSHILIKLNQIGTVTELSTPSELAPQAGYNHHFPPLPVETEDTFIAIFAVLHQLLAKIKTGSASRTDRIAKYNQLLRIEEELGSAARFNGKAALS